MSWFIRFETILSMYQLSNFDKFVTLASLIPPELDAVLQHTWLNINLQPAESCFDIVKAALLKCTTVTSAERSYRLMTLPYLGQKQPSELMAELIKLVDPPGSFSIDNLHLFLSRLPYDLARHHTEKTADSVSDPMSFALKLDRDLEGSRRRQRSSNNFANRPQRLTLQTPMSQPNRPGQANPSGNAQKTAAPKTGSQTTWRGSLTPASSASASNDVCFYHQKFGNQATKCLHGCKWRAMAIGTDNAGEAEVETGVVRRHGAFG